jgi:DNA polymerase-3 subunit beta
VKFRCERDALADAVGTASRAAARSAGAFPALSGVKLELSGDSLTVTGTDLELTIGLQLPVGGDRDGAVVIPARLLTDIVKNLPSGSVELVHDSDEVRISAGRSQFTVRPLSLGDYPIQQVEETTAVTLSSEDVTDALRQVVRAASADESRIQLTGVLIAAEDSGIKMVATDSYRLAVRDLPQSSMLEAGQRVLVPSRALAELQRLLGNGSELRARLGDHIATFEVGSVQLTTRLIESEYPNYSNLVPNNNSNLLTVGREELLDAIRRVKVLAHDATPVRLDCEASTLTVSVVTQDIGTASEVLDCRYEGIEMSIAFNPDYLISGIDAIESEEITLATREQTTPAVMRGAGRDDYLYLLMPVRLPA